jgi:hypothetical protein
MSPNLSQKHGIRFYCSNIARIVSKSYINISIKEKTNQIIELMCGCMRNEKTTK